MDLCSEVRKEINESADIISKYQIDTNKLMEDYKLRLEQNKKTVKLILNAKIPHSNSFFNKDTLEKAFKII